MIESWLEIDRLKVTRWLFCLDVMTKRLSRKHQQGKKTIWSTNRERRSCNAPAGEEFEAPTGKEDPAELASCQFLTLVAIFFSLVNYLSILVKRHKRNISVKLFWNRLLALEMFFKVFFFFFSSCNHFVQQSRTILAILVKGHKRNIDVKLF